MKNKIKLLKGQSLIEVVVVIAMTAIVLLALVILGNVAIRNTTLTLQRSEAYKLATSAMEAVRYVRDTTAAGCNITSLLPSTGPYCFDISNGCSGSTCICNTLELKTPCSHTPDDSAFGHYNIENTDFSRIIIVDQGADPETATVDVLIRWPVGSGNEEYKLSSILTANN